MSTANVQSEFSLDNYIMHHVLDSHHWQLPFLPPIHLPEFLSLHGLMLILCAVFMVVLFCLVYRRNDRVPTGITNALEALILFIRDQIAIPFLGAEDGRKLTPLLCTQFFFILFLNVMGLIPLFATATANINVTGSLAFVTLTCMIVGGMMRNGPIGFFKAFMPHGVPIPILILLVPIEVAGIFIKAFALMIRLFANMLAGHIVIFALLGLVVILGLGALPAVLLAVFIYLLEVLVAFLQAYIFTLLSAMFIGQLLHPEH